MKKSQKPEQEPADKTPKDPSAFDEAMDDLPEVSPEEAPQEPEATELEERLADQENRYLRLFAEFENYKKRNQRERLQLMETAGRNTMKALLPVLDDFERARQNAEQTDRLEDFDSGIGLIVQKLRSTLAAQGLRAMESTGEPFDADLHEAVTRIPAPDESQIGRVIDTVETGYTLNGTIIRHAKVVVGA